MQSFRILSNLHLQQQQQLIPDLPVQAADAHININKKGSSLNVLQGGVDIDIEAEGKEFSSSKDEDEVGDIRGLSSYDSTVAADLNVMKQKDQDNRTQGKNFYSITALDLDFCAFLSNASLSLSCSICILYCVHFYTVRCRQAFSYGCPI